MTDVSRLVRKSLILLQSWLRNTILDFTYVLLALIPNLLLHFYSLCSLWKFPLDYISTFLFFSPNVYVMIFILFLILLFILLFFFVQFHPGGLLWKKCNCSRSWNGWAAVWRAVSGACKGFDCTLPVNQLCFWQAVLFNFCLNQ